MPYDPSFPPSHGDLTSAAFRANFNGLDEKLTGQIAGIPAGAPGRDGRDGVDGRGIAELRDSGDGTGRVIVVLTDGAEHGPFTVGTGPAGADGRDGTSLVMSGDWNNGTGYTAGSVVAYEGQLYVAMDYVMGAPPVMDGRWRLLSITGPQGNSGGPGGPGEKGDKGDKGDTGEQGPPGEVTALQLTDAIAGTARNPAAIGPFTGDFSDPPTQSEMRAFRDWANNFFSATAR